MNETSIGCTHQATPCPACRDEAARRAVPKGRGMTEGELRAMERHADRAEARTPAATYAADVRLLVAEVRSLRARCEKYREALIEIANADHAEDGGPTCNHPDVAERASVESGTGDSVTRCW